MKYIIVEKRLTNNYYTAYLKKDKTIWGCGKTKNDAIVDCITTHYTIFDIGIVEK